ncbi:helix-turn-helix domain-containing protein [Fluviibacterium sp. DFM31]|uniref:Helix-turn-helix domain-containing protein n=1 Tax=Meridianimarinicoccus marinus TaxID=3231483 RepID=A0ABV3LA20_9RHOB
MSVCIPLIRSATVTPIRRWLRAQGKDPAPFFAQAGLEWVPESDPLVPIPLRAAIRLLVGVAQAEGPNASWRIVRDGSVAELGLIGHAALRGPTVREGLLRVVRMMPQHVTHELFSVEGVGEALHVRDGWTLNIGSDEVLHLVQQYVAAFVDVVCRSGTKDRTSLSRVSMIPHPQAGLSHLRPWLGASLQASANRALDIWVDRDVADRTIPAPVIRAAMEGPTADQPLVPPGCGLAGSAAVLVTAMLPYTKPSVDRIAAAADLSPRTLRRRLRDEGVSFSDVVEQTRARIALERLRDDGVPSLKDLSEELGYANQATLTRAVRRWTGQLPSALRQPR